MKNLPTFWYIMYLNIAHINLLKVIIVNEAKMCERWNNCWVLFHPTSVQHHRDTTATPAQHQLDYSLTPCRVALRVGPTQQKRESMADKLEASRRVFGRPLATQRILQSGGSSITATKTSNLRHAKIQLKPTLNIGTFKLNLSFISTNAKGKRQRIYS